MRVKKNQTLALILSLTIFFNNSGVAVAGGLDKFGNTIMGSDRGSLFDPKAYDKIGTGNNPLTKSQYTKVGQEARQKCELDKNKLATMAALAFGMLAAERWVALSKADKTVKATEKMIDNLFSQNAGLDTSGGAGGGTGSGGGYNAAGGGYGGGAGTPGTTTTGQGTNLANGFGNTADNFGGQSFGATAGGGLDNHMLQGPLGRKLADKLDHSGLTPGKIARMLDTGGASGAASGVLGAMGLPSTMVPTIAGTAKEIEAMGGTLFPTSYAASGGSAGPSTTKAGEQPNLMDGMDMNQANRDPASMDFVNSHAQAMDANDIWHSGSSDNIFQIVSKRIGVSATRVGQ